MPLLATFINQLLPVDVVLGKGITAAWASKYALHWQDCQNSKSPGSDGLLVAVDPSRTAFPFDPWSAWMEG